MLLIALVAVFLYFGVRLSTRSQLALALVSMLVVLIFFITVIVKLGSANSVAPFKPSSASDGWSGIFFGVLYGVLLFVGFETAANLAEETPNPRREIPIAIMSTAAIATVFFVLATYVEVAGFHFSLSKLTAAAWAPLFALGAPASAGGYGSVWVDRLLELVVLFDMVAVVIGCAVSGSRGIFAMARDRRVPAQLAIVSKRHGTPLGAAAFLVAASVATLLVNQFWTGLFALPKTPHYFALFAWGSTFGGFALVVVYLLMCVGSLRDLRDQPQPGPAGHRGGHRHPGHGGRHLRLVLQGHQPHDLGGLAGAGPAGGRVRIHVLLRARTRPAPSCRPDRGPGPMTAGGAGLWRGAVTAGVAAGERGAAGPGHRRRDGHRRGGGRRADRGRRPGSHLRPARGAAGRRRGAHRRPAGHLRHRRPRCGGAAGGPRGGRVGGLDGLVLNAG